MAGPSDTNVTLYARAGSRLAASFPRPSRDAEGTTADAASATRIVELDPPGRDGAAVGPGVWEASGIIDASGLFGPGTWLFDVQAHRPTAAPASGTVEDGQLLLLAPTA